MAWDDLSMPTLTQAIKRTGTPFARLSKLSGALIIAAACTLFVGTLHSAQADDKDHGSPNRQMWSTVSELPGGPNGQAGGSLRTIASPEVFAPRAALVEDGGGSLGGTAFIGSTPTALGGNWVETMIDDFLGVLGFAPDRQQRASRLGNSFGQLEEYQEIYYLAAGWNGDKFQQYQLGLAFEFGDRLVKVNLPAAYFWYTLAAAQDFQAADAKRQDLAARTNPDRALQPEDKDEVFLHFIDVYISGGAEGQYRLGNILDSEFFKITGHNQDDVDVIVRGDEARTSPGQPRLAVSRRLIFSYAAYLLAAESGHPNAEDALQHMRNKYNFTDTEISEARRVAQNWARHVGMAPDPSNPFKFDTDVVVEALDRGSDFQGRRRDLTEQDDARSWLRAGQAFQARGDIRRSKVHFETAIRKNPQSRAALQAVEALQNLTTTCSASSDPDDLQRVRYVRLAAQQHALTALGYYDGPVDNKPGRQTRSATRRFLASLNVDVQDYLTEPQVVELICKAAQIRQYAPSQNQLGIMYANGIGVPQSDDLAHYWFGAAALQNDPGAILNMGLMFANRRVGPFRNHPQGCEIARAYVREAAELGNPDARRLLKRANKFDACVNAVAMKQGGQRS